MNALPPRFSLALLPTPLVEAFRLSKVLDGPRILFKRDDLTGFGFGGNKVRGLEFYMAEALAQEADVIVTGAGPQSNHVRATAAAARVTRLDLVAVIHGSRPSEPRGNLLLNDLLGVELRFTDDPNRELLDTRIEEVAEELRQVGRRPYVIPRGGASALGAVGYLECASELSSQLEERDARPDWLVVATGSGGTQAGLLAGAKLFDAPYRIMGVTVSRPVVECLPRIRRFAMEAARLAGSSIEVGEEEILVRDGFIGPGYGIPSTEGIDAIRRVARAEGIFLDPTYTGKAMAALFEEIAAGRIGNKETVLFLHTGGEPALFAHCESLTHSY